MPYPFYLIFIIMFIMLSYWLRRERVAGRRGVRRITGYGVAFCVLSFNLWVSTQMADITTISGAHSSGIFTTWWPWIAALGVGISLLVISFLTRKNSRYAA